MVKSLSPELAIRVLIISRGRYDTISTTSLLPDEVEVLVPESEKKLYEANIKNPILTIPDDQIGLGMVRNWVLDHFKEEIIVMVDDDISCMYNLQGKLSRRINDPEEMMQVILNTAVMAYDSGAKVFGYSQTDIRKYKGTDPFKELAMVKRITISLDEETVKLLEETAEEECRTKSGLIKYLLQRYKKEKEDANN